MKRLANNRLGAKTIWEWLPQNRGFYASFRRWLREGGYGDSALNLYGVAARLALGYLDKAYWLIFLKNCTATQVPKYTPDTPTTVTAIMWTTELQKGASGI